MKNRTNLDYSDHVSLHFTCDSFFEDIKGNKKKSKGSLFSSEATTVYDIQDEPREVHRSSGGDPIELIIEEMGSMDRLKVTDTEAKSRKRLRKRTGRKKRTLRMAHVIARSWVHYFKLI